MDNFGNRYRCIQEIIFFKTSPTGCWKMYGETIYSPCKTENIPYRFPKLNKYCHKFVGRVK